jgi:hypothetical protein
MRKHNGIRPQDIVILLKIATLQNEAWQLSTLSNSLHISISEISESLNRSKLAKLLSEDKKKVQKLNLLEFLEHGIKYVFPYQGLTISRGVPTAISHPEINQKFISDQTYVWPCKSGSMVGLGIEPLIPKICDYIESDPKLYKNLSLVELLRMGKVREQEYAIKQLKSNL